GSAAPYGASAGAGRSAPPRRLHRQETAARGTTLDRPRTRGQVGEQRHLQRLARIEELVVDAGRSELAAIAIDERAHLSPVMIADGAGHRHDLLARFQ